MTNVFAQQQLQVLELFPDLAGWRVIALGIELEEIDESIAGIVDRARDLESNEGYFAEEAVEKAIESALVVSRAPPGHAFARLIKEGERPITVMIKVRDPVST